MDLQEIRVPITPSINLFFNAWEIGDVLTIPGSKSDISARIRVEVDSGTKEYDLGLSRDKFFQLFRFGKNRASIHRADLYNTHWRDCLVDALELSSYLRSDTNTKIMHELDPEVLRTIQMYHSVDEDRLYDESHLIDFHGVMEYLCSRKSPFCVMQASMINAGVFNIQDSFDLIEFDTNTKQIWAEPLFEGRESAIEHFFKSINGGEYSDYSVTIMPTSTSAVKNPSIREI